MRVLLVPERSSDIRDPGGFVPGLASALERRGHEVTVSRSSWSGSPPDVVHTHGAWSGVAGVPLVHTFHQLDDGLPDVAHAVVTCAADVRHVMRGGVPRSRVTMIPRGVDTEHFVPEGPDASVGELGRLLYVGPPDPSCLGVVAALRGVPGAELVVVTRSATGPLLDFARQVGVANRVRVVRRCAYEDLPALMRSAEVVVCPSWTRSSGRTVLEAMACGVPVVAAAVGSQADIVVDGITGLLVPPRRLRELTVALRRLVGNGLVREQWGASARDRACARYSWSRVAAEHERVYAAALETARPALVGQ